MTPEEATELVNAKLPCICLPAYKDRGRIQPDCPRCNYGEEMAELVREAAGEREEMRKALEPFAELARAYESIDGQHDYLDLDSVIEHLGGLRITVGNLRNARTLLARAGAEGKQDA